MFPKPLDAHKFDSCFKQRVGKQFLAFVRIQKLSVGRRVRHQTLKRLIELFQLHELINRFGNKCVQFVASVVAEQTVKVAFKQRRRCGIADVFGRRTAVFFAEQ
ncbi:MAG: hypothetical protein EBR09_02600 [Proteobacteria bacterium]|nr:hypothetical protein [Pseudomonadota bacterium]